MGVEREGVRGLESDKKVREGEEDKVVRDRKKNKAMNILYPLDVEIVTSHCRVPYGTAADGAHSLLHAGRGSFAIASMENIQETNER